MSKKILVIGGSGFLGAGLCLSFLREGHCVINYSRGISPWLFAGAEDLSNLRTVKASILDEAVLKEAVREADIIFHYGAVSTVRGAAQDISACFNTNVMGTANLAKVLREAGSSVEKLILASSISVYGEGVYQCGKCGFVRPSLRQARSQCVVFEPVCHLCEGVIRPCNIREGAERNGESVYAKSKIEQEDILTALAQDTGVPLAILRYATIYGPGQPETSPYRGFLKQMSEGKRVTLTEDGLQTRDFLFVEDVMAVNKGLLEHSWKGVGVFNVGSGVPLPLSHFVEEMRKEYIRQSGFLIPPVETTSEILAGDVRHCNVDCSRLQALNFIKSTTSLELGLKSTVKAFHDVKHSISNQGERVLK